MLSREGALVAPLRIVLALMAAGVALCFFTAQAQAAPGAYKVLLAESYPDLPKKLAEQVSAFPDVAAVDLVNTGEEEGTTPTAAQLGAYDIVVSIGDSTYLDYEGWGNALAGYVDGGGVVVTTTYDTWDGGGSPTGRWLSGNYSPFQLGPNDNEFTTLGSFDAASPLMKDVPPGSLETELNTTNALQSGASLVASWADGRPAVAVKGRVVGISAFIGDTYGDVWGGNFGQVIVNAVRSLGKQRLTVTNSNSAGGIVTSDVGGISCGSTCSADLLSQTPVNLTATANKGFAFSGFTGSCTGVICALTMDSGKSVTAGFSPYGFGKVKLNRKKGTATLTVKVGAPGKLVASGKKIKKRSRAASKAGKVKLPIIAKGKALKTLQTTGKVKVKAKVAYTPTGGATSAQAKKIVLKLDE